MRQHQRMDRPGVRQVSEGSGEQGKNGGNWLRNHLWCPSDPRGKGIDEMRDGGGFFLACKDFGSMLKIHSPPALFLKWRLARTQ